METSEMRKELLQWIDEADDRLIETIYAAVRAYHEEDEFEFTEEQIKKLDEMRERQLRDESKLYTWEEAERHKIIMQERAQHLKGEGETYTWEEVKQSILSGKRL